MIVRMESVESRAFLSIAALDPSYGTDGIARVVKTPGLLLSGQTFPLANGDVVVKVGETDIRRLDVNGQIVKSFGGGDGVMSPRNVATLVAVDPASGRIATIMVDRVNGATIQFYKSRGTFERSVTGKFGGEGIFEVRGARFDASGRLLIASASKLTAIDPHTGAPDPSFGSGGVIALPTGALPAGTVLNYYDDLDYTPEVFVEAVLTNPIDGTLTVVREYNVDRRTAANQTFRHSSHLDVRRFTADGQPLTGNDAVRTVAFGYYQIPTGTGEVRTEAYDNAGYALAADSGLIVRAHRTQIRTGGAVPTQYGEWQLLRIVNGQSVARRLLDNAFQLEKGYCSNPGLTGQTTDASGRRLFVVGNGRVAQFDALTLKPFTSYNGPTGSRPLSSNRAGGPVVDARGRLLLNDGRRIRAVIGAADNVLGAPAGQATLLDDGTLAVEGTSKRDVIEVAYQTKGRVKVQVNDRLQNFFLSDFTGIYVHGGGGNDSISAKTSPRAVYVQPGSGDDAFVGSAFPDTIDGGSGRDTVRGGGGLDLAFLFNQDDTIQDAERAEEYFSTDEALLFA